MVSRAVAHTVARHPWPAPPPARNPGSRPESPMPLQNIELRGVVTGGRAATRVRDLAHPAHRRAPTPTHLQRRPHAVPDLHRFATTQHSA